MKCPKCGRELRIVGGVDLGDPKGDKSAKYVIDTLELKEVDLEKEIVFQWSKFCLNGKDREPFVKVAKYFFELGLKAQKGE